MNIEVGQVGDLVYDPMTGDMGVITGKSLGLFDICWCEGYSRTFLRTTEKHTDFVYHPDYNEDLAGYCLANDKEKYYENR